MIASIFNTESISEEELEKMKSQDAINAILHEFTATFPKLKVPLIDERDQYLAQKIKEAPGEKASRSWELPTFPALSGRSTRNTI